MKKTKKIAFVYYSFSSFIRQDYEILSKYFDVNKVNYRNILDVFKIMRAVLKSGISFSWFADGWAFFAVLFSKIFRKKTIVVLGGYDVADEPEIQYGIFTRSKLRQWMTKFVLRHATILLPVSEFTNKETLKYVNFPRQLSIVHNSVDTVKFKPIGEKEDLVITVGGVTDDNVKRKGFETFVKSAIYLPNTKFVLIGRHGDNSIEYLKSIAPSNVSFTGFILDEELLRYYQKAKVYCQLSYYESFGVALAKAMLCECVPVLTNNAALPEVAGDAGFYVPYGDPEATADGIEKALKSNKGKEARTRIKNKFPIQRREKELVGIVKCLVDVEGVKN